MEYEKNDNLIFSARCIGDVKNLLNGIFDKKKMALGISDEDLFELATHVVTEAGFLYDVVRAAESDPAAKRSCAYVYDSYLGVRAMMYYRVAHAILQWDVLENVDAILINTIVRSLCERGKVETGIDIHPMAQIGEGCVIDHGVGTKIMDDQYAGHTVVIGETAIIGQECTILNDVVIGAADVNKGLSVGRRHPCIGDEVTICAGAKILGKISVGNKVFIGPGCRVCHDIPDNTDVTIMNQLQIMKIKDRKAVIVDGVVFDGNKLILYGENIKEVDIVLVDSKYNELTYLNTEILERTDYWVSFVIKSRDILESLNPLRNIHLKITLNERFYYVSAPVIVRVVKKIVNK